MDTFGGHYSADHTPKPFLSVSLTSTNASPAAQPVKLETCEPSSAPLSSLTLQVSQVPYVLQLSLSCLLFCSSIQSNLRSCFQTPQSVSPSMFMLWRLCFFVLICLKWLLPSPPDRLGRAPRASSVLSIAMLPHVLTQKELLEDVLAQHFANTAALTTVYCSSLFIWPVLAM